MRTKWGQNFLAHPPTMRRIVDALRVGPGEPVLEIGPGRGALTQYLVEQTKKVLAVELDETLAEKVPQSKDS
jgi:16S rRNA (adenine1518-N6/adenine1519-N6)-dimethyltransferase